MIDGQMFDRERFDPAARRRRRAERAAACRAGPEHRPYRV